MQSILYNAKLWLGHAEQVRTLSKAVTDPRTKQHMLNVAAGFDRIAHLAAQLRSTNGRSPQNEQRLMSRPVRSAA